MNIKLALRTIFQESEVVFAKEESLGTPDLVPFCEKIRKIYKDHPSFRQLIEDAFIEDFDIHQECTWELAAVCMYHLKLPHYKSHLEGELVMARAKEDWRSVPVIESILAAYDEPWECYDLFYESNS